LLVDPEIQELRKKAEQAINNGDYEAADKYLDEALERQMVCINNAEKQLTNCKLSAAEMKVDKGDLELIRINYKAATKLFKEAVELVPDSHELKKSEYLQKWGDAADYAGLYDESQIALEQCLAIRERLLPKDDTDIATTLNNLAELYRSQGKYEDAEPLYQRSLGIREPKLGKDHPAEILIRYNIRYNIGTLKYKRNKACNVSCGKWIYIGTQKLNIFVFTKRLLSITRRENA